jgi:hypothetical protein
MTSAAPPPRTTIDFARALTFIKDDPRWLAKIGIGSLVSLSTLLLVGIPPLTGYFQRVIRRVAEGEVYPLPEWEDWGGLFADGLKALAMVALHLLVIGLPISAMACLAGFAGGMKDKMGASGSGLEVLLIGRNQARCSCEPVS